MASNRRQREAVNAWPGYVDALSTLLMVIIFVLLVFVLAQAFLSVALSTRDRALDRLHRQVTDISDMLSLERQSASDLRSALSRLNIDLSAALGERDAILRQLADTRTERDRMAGDLSASRGERDRLSAQLADLAAQGGASEARVRRLEQQLTETLARGETQGTEVERAARDLADLRRRLSAQGVELERTSEQLTTSRREAASSAEAIRRATAELDSARREIAALREQAASLDREVQVGRDTIAARLSDLARLQNQVQALTALRDDLERQTQDALARAEAAGQARTGAEAERQAAQARAEAEARARAEAAAGQQSAEARAASEARARAEAEAARQAAQGRATEATRLSESAQAQAALLSRQLAEIRAELRALNAALEASESRGRDQETQIANLGARLNTALAQRVEELQRYRSDFFGRLRAVLGDRPGVQIVGDRFVFQSEVLFGVGNADLSGEGADRIRDLAITLRELIRQIPADIPWVLRVDGHADNSPIRSGGPFASNWELSAARAVNVVRLLVTLGFPPERLAATGFGEFQPIDTADTPAARARNRRIEFRLTDR